MSTVIYLENGLCPQNRRVEQHSGSIRELAPNWQTPYVAFLGGQAILRKDWDIIPTDDQTLAFIDVDAIPQGGGGGSNPLRLVLMIAVMVYAPGLAQGLVFGSGIGAAAALGSTGLAIFNAAAVFVGMSLVNAVAPPPKPTSPQQAAALAAPSPTYSLQAQGNSARLEAAIPEHFGRHIVYPDFGAQPYAEYAGNEQYLYQLLVIGRGSYDLEELKIEDTPSTSFDEITTEIIQPYGQVTLFPAAVTTSVEVSGQTLSPTVVGPFVANAVGTLANKLAFDFVAPRGLYYANDDGSLSERTVTVIIEVATVDDDGNLTSGWTNLTIGAGYTPWSDWTFVQKLPNSTNPYTNTATQEWEVRRGLQSWYLYTRTRTVTDGAQKTAASTTPQRWSLSYDVTPARYTARVSRVGEESTASREANSVVWAGLRAYQPDVAGKNYGDCTLLAMRMRASDNLSAQASRKINLIATRKLPIWNGTSWSALTATRNPAWAMTYAAKQVGLTDAQIDLQSMLTLANGCTARGDTFDARFDNFLSFWEAATKIAQSVRAKPYMQGGILRVVRDQAATIPVALFSQRNIVKGSFSVNYLMPTEDTADSVDVSYFDDIKWAPAKVRSTLAGSTAAKPAKIDIFGVTSRAQAWREGLYQAACNKYRRKIISFQTEMEGFIPSFGDLIAIQHDMPAWGQGGEVVKVTRNLLRYSEQFDNAVWVKVGSTVSPSIDGVRTVYKLIETNTTGPHNIQQTYVAPAGVSIPLSIKAKADTRKNIRLSGRGGNWVVFPEAYFDLEFGTLLSSTVPAVIENLGDGWFRCSITGITTTGVNSGLNVNVVNTSGVTSYTGDGVSGIYIDAAQLEINSIVGPYIPTSANPVTGLTLSEPPVFTTGLHYLGLRKRDGSVDGPYACTATMDPYTVALGSDPVINPYTGQMEERTHYAFGPGVTWRQPARVLSAKPQSLHIVSIEAVNEDDSVHTADTGVTMPVQVFSQLSGYQNAPQVLGVTARFLFNYSNMATVSWQPAPWANKYEVQSSSGDGVWSHVGETSATSLNFTATYGKTTLVRVAASNLSRGAWAQSMIAIVPPFDPTGLSYTQELGGVRIKWDERLETNFYELRTGASWDTATLIAPVTGTEYLWAAQPTGTITLWLKSIDANGNYSTNAISLNAVITGPGAPDASYETAGPDEVLSWTIPTSGFTVDRYEIRQGASWAAGVKVDSTKATSYRRKVDYSGARTYWIAAVDVQDNYGEPDSLSVNITIPSVVTSQRVEVIDNNVLLFWNPPTTGTLPVDRYEVRKGASWASGEVVGSNGNSTFAAVFEQSGGTYTYWIAAVDSAGNFGVAASIVAAVSQPPDYILRNDMNSDFSGTKVNALPFEGGLLLPVNTTETWTQHFVNNGYATPQAQITAGNPLYIEPGMTSATYTEAIDYGTTLPATTISVTLNSTAVAGAVTASCQIKYSNVSATGPWTNAPAGATSTLATNFRWVQVVYTFTAAGGPHLLKVNALNIKLSVKNRTDSGSGVITNATTGVYIPFGYAFIDADTPIVQPQGTVPLIAVVDYTDTPNPTGFTVYLYTTAGVKTTGSFSWTVRGY